MSDIIKITKPIIIKYEERETKLSKDIKEKIEIFWKKAVEENPNLYNGPDYTIEKIEENENEIKMIATKTNYAHYLYDERVGIKDKEYKCNVPWGGIILETKDNYLVLGEMDEKTSVPHCLQIPGGGIDKKDICNGIINVSQTIKRELEEEINLNLDDINYEIKYIEIPDEKRDAYGFIAIGKLEMTKEELQKHFEEYKKFLIQNNLEVEFNKLIFLHKSNAMEEFKTLKNPKRPYFSNLINEIVRGDEKMIKNIVFDLGNVLMEFNPLEYLEKFKFDEKIKKSLYKIIFKSNDWIEYDRGIYRHNTDLIKKLVKENPDLENEIKLVLQKDWVKMHTIKSDTVEFLKELKKQGFKIYILSNLSEDTYKFVSQFNFFNFVDGGIYSYELHICKPDKEIYKKLLEKYNLEAKETIFIDDIFDNIKSANELGINAIQFTTLDEVRQKVNLLI